METPDSKLNIISFSTHGELHLHCWPMNTLVTSDPCYPSIHSQPTGYELTPLSYGVNGVVLISFSIQQCSLQLLYSLFFTSEKKNLSAALPRFPAQYHLYHYLCQSIGSNSFGS